MDVILGTGRCLVTERRSGRLATDDPLQAPLCRISRSTVQRAALTPSRCNGRQTLCTP
ncbi:conserved hypothetical protein [Candidatus Contendobacter odensis Run_B_J11]|uniref:Uncharacterized protein n=1 Tax=Candidatus Contendobacter odensis Run_B_J11 TaxID=1400861 RepID=A0A7U7GCR4_9GAMM|nr:conserved hypothetical protein [Candidatus Contendobacter odensis Run_B_J11]